MTDRILSYDAYADAEMAGFKFPYVVELANGPQHLIFYGSHHTNDPADEQFADLEDRWQDFTAHATNPLVLVEGYSDTWPEEATADKHQSILSGGESQLMVHLARRDGLSVICPEPDQIEQATQLADEFGKDEVTLFNFLSRLHWLGQSTEKVDLEIEMPKILKNLQETYQWDDVDFSVDSMKALYERVAGKPFDAHDQGALNDAITPAKLDTVLNDISRRSGDLRDERLLAQIEESWAEGHCLFVVYGAAHAIRLEQSLRKLSAA